ncbi:MAG: branched-chain amino acid transport system II carrier protein [Candidatus Berkiellales bacterium]
MKLPSLPSPTIVCSTGVAIFAMFFGSGNVVFPLLLGQTTGNQVGWALIGLTLTAVGAPLLGLLGSVLFEGDCKQFFYRIGSVPGYLVVLLILALLGPLGVMPRCFIVAFAAIKPYFPQLSLLLFSQIAGVITLLFIAKRAYILPLLGMWLSPLLICTLLVVIITSIVKMESLHQTAFTPFTAMIEGLGVGYNTMDLLASIIFSVSIWMLLKEKLNLSDEKSIHRQLVPTYVLASLIGGGLLGLIYLGMSFSAAAHPHALANAAPEQVLTHLSIYILGHKLAIIANIAVILACLTTVMSLAVAVVDVIHVEIMNTKIGSKIPFSYVWMMLIVIVITVIFSNLGFVAIMNFLDPILAVCYPAIIVLAICNILYKLYGFPYVKIPVYATLAITVLWTFVVSTSFTS